MTDDLGFYVILESKGGLKARRFIKMMILALGARAERGSTRA
jgi:hypothetical protein